MNGKRGSIREWERKWEVSLKEEIIREWGKYKRKRKYERMGREEEEIVNGNVDGHGREGFYAKFAIVSSDEM